MVTVLRVYTLYLTPSKMLKVNFNQLRDRIKKLKKIDMFSIFADVMIGLLLLRFILSCLDAIF